MSSNNGVLRLLVYVEFARVFGLRYGPLDIGAVRLLACVDATNVLGLACGFFTLGPGSRLVSYLLEVGVIPDLSLNGFWQMPFFRESSGFCRCSFIVLWLLSEGMKKE